MNLTLFGINHKTAPIEVREKIYFPAARLEGILSGIKSIPGIDECLLLSTCNRTEIYLNTEKQDNLIDKLSDLLVDLSKIEKNKLKRYFYHLEGLSAIDQLMRVASGLDSMIVGEGQILGQVKDAFRLARHGKFTGPVLNSLFNRAISAGKRARSETAISIGAVSVSSTAVELARSIFDDLSKHQVLIIGAGEMSELALKHLISYGVRSVLVSNRTYDKAKELAEKFAGSAVYYDKISEYLVQSDIIISSTGAPHLLLKKEDVSKIMSRRAGRPVFFIDIAVPRDIEQSVSEIEDVFLYDIDDLGQIVEKNKKIREKEIPKIEKIIEEEKQRYLNWYSGRQGRE